MLKLLKLFLKNLRIFVLRGQREKNLADVLSKLINDNFKDKKIKILDYGSGFEPKVIQFIYEGLSAKGIECTAHCYDLYSDNDLSKLNQNSKEKYFNIENLNTNNEFYNFAIISDTLHHIGIDNSEYIKEIILQLKSKSDYLIIKDNFEWGFFSRQIMRFMDFIGNYYNDVSIPKKYYTKKQFEEFLEKLNIKVIKKIINERYYSKVFLFFSNPKLHFIYLM